MPVCGRFIPARAGTLAFVHLGLVGGRFIPARAGNTPAGDVLADLVRFIPARAGNTSAARAGRRHLRFIPARAGNTMRITFGICATSVHPRTGGEHLSRYTTPASTPGSSPHGRGTQRSRDKEAHEYRFIPARAGNTPAWPDSRYRSPVHPARAGNTFGTVAVMRSAPVHPRTGGEHCRATHGGPMSGGSSPHGRGTPGNHERHVAADRFIPARAGNTLGPAVWRCG